jgi:hypothetical protein
MVSPIIPGSWPVVSSPDDLSLCSDEVAKIIAVLRTTDRYADISKPSSMWQRDVIVPSANGSPQPTPATVTDQSQPSSSGSTPVGSIVVPDPSKTPTTTLSVAAQLVEIQQILRSKAQIDIQQILNPMMQVVVDPSLSGYVTGAALASTLHLVQYGSHDIFLKNKLTAGSIIDAVTKTKFTETDRDSDETVLMKIVAIIELILTKGSIDKVRVALGLQCIQTIWIQDNHTAALKDTARQAVSRVLIHILSLPTGCDGYATTLVENVCLNMELLSKQPVSSFDSDKLSFFVDIVGALSRIKSNPQIGKWSLEMVPYQVMNALHYLIPPASAAVAIDASGSGILLRNSQSLPIAATLLSIGNSMTRRLVNSSHPTSALAVEALVMTMYCRGLSPLQDTELKLAGLGDTALHLLSAKKAVASSVAPHGYITVMQPMGLQQPVVQQILAMILESLSQIVKEPNFVGLLWESFDCVWHRNEVASTLIDGVVNSALSSKVIALTHASKEDQNHDRDRVIKALSAFQALAASPESQIDMDSMVPSYVECLSMNVLKDIIVSLYHTSMDAGDSASKDQTPNQFLLRLSSKEVAKQIKSKPKKAGEIVESFLREFSRDIDRDTPDIAWGLRLIPSVDFETLGEFFGQPGEASSQSLASFIKSLNLVEMDPEEALRACLQSFRLPGEAQQIDRIIKEIAYEYYGSHSDLKLEGNFFASADAAYTFLFSVIMLNTDQHNPQVKKRMELKDFLRNNRKINEGEDIPEDVQTRVFNSIRNSQIVTPKSGSYFCCPLKGRWKDLWYLNQTGYIPNKLRLPGKHTVHRLLASKGYDILIAAAYVMARDPKRHTKAVEVVAGLADICLRQVGGDPIVKSIGTDCVTILKRYGIKSFATAISNINPTPRSYDCFAALLKLDGTTADSLLEAVSSLLCYWSAYSVMLSEFLQLPETWQEVLVLPTLDLGSNTAGGSAISSIFRGLLTPLYDQDEKSTTAAQTESTIPELEDPGEQMKEDDPVARRRKSSTDSLVLASDWREQIIRQAFVAGSPNCPTSQQLMSLQLVEVDKYLSSVIADQEKSSGIVLMMFEIIHKATSSKTDEFWSKELVRSSPWAILLASRILAGSKNSDLLSSTAARDAIIGVIRNYVSGNLNDIRGLKITVFCAFALVTLFAQKDPQSNVIDPAWILPVLDELTTLGQENNSIVAGICPVVCLSINMMLTDSPQVWKENLGAPIWRECIKLVSAVCPKAKTSDAETGKKICLETVQALLLNNNFLNSVSVAANGANDMTDCVVAYEHVLQARASPKVVAKTLSELACRLASNQSCNGVGIAWTCVVGRVTARVTGVAKQKRPTGPELSDSVELLRMCLGHPRATQILTPVQAGMTVEKCASALSAVVSANTPPGALQAALCVFARFFLTCLDKLQQHAQFDHHWLMSLRVILLFIKRGHDDPSMEQLAEITTETLRNALQVLIASGLLQLPVDNPPEDVMPVWWKVTWEIVDTFCPGMWDELKGESEHAEQPKTEVQDTISVKNEDEKPEQPQEEEENAQIAENSEE